MWIWKDEYQALKDRHMALYAENASLTTRAKMLLDWTDAQKKSIADRERRIKDLKEEVARERRRAERAIDIAMQLKTNFATYGAGPDMKEAVQSEMVDPFAEVPEIVEEYHDQMRKDRGEPLRQMAAEIGA